MQRNLSSLINQRGITLVICMIVLLMLTLLAITAMRMGVMNQKMIYNSADAQRAFLSADSAIRDAETMLNSLVDTSAFTNSNGLYQTGNAPDPFASTTWSGSASITANSTSGAQTPQYFVEYMGSQAGQGSQATSVNIGNYGDETGAVESSTAFRIVALGTGASGIAQSMIEAYYVTNM